MPDGDILGSHAILLNFKFKITKLYHLICI